MKGPGPPCRFKEVESAVDIGMYEYLGTQYASVHMGFRSKIYHPVYLEPVEDFLDHGLVTNIPSAKKVSVGIGRFNIFEVGRISCIGEFVEIDNLDIFSVFQEMPYEVASDETASAGDQSFHIVPYKHKN
jgi:hypothetical protein